jgi:hypothetical protein
MPVSSNNSRAAPARAAIYKTDPRGMKSAKRVNMNTTVSFARGSQEPCPKLRDYIGLRPNDSYPSTVADKLGQQPGSEESARESSRNKKRECLGKSLAEQCPSLYVTYHVLGDPRCSLPLPLLVRSLHDRHVRPEVDNEEACSFFEYNATRVVHGWGVVQIKIHENLPDRVD